MPIRSRPSHETHVRLDHGDEIAARVHVIRGNAVLMEVDLARVCGMTPARFLEHLRRWEPLPGEFCFEPERDELAAAEVDDVGGRFPRCAFTEQGALVAVILLDSRRAIAVGTSIVRAFGKIRQPRANRAHAPRAATGPSLDFGSAAPTLPQFACAGGDTAGRPSSRG